MTQRLFGVLAVLFGTACANHPSPISGRAPLDTHPETTMTKTTPKSTAPVTWFSVPADDIQRATAFYRQAFGWKIEPLTQERGPRLRLQRRGQLTERLVVRPE